MEESVGKLWDRLVTRAARRNHAEAAVRLEAVAGTAGIVFRAFGGAPGVRLVGAPLRAHGARRHWLARVAGTDTRAAFAACDAEALRLLAEIDYFPDAETNRDLYLWLAALAAACPPLDAGNWFAANQRATRALLARWPGLRPRYRRLVEATLALRPEPAMLPAAEAVQERALRRALREPGWWRLPPLPRRGRPLAPVVLWLYPAPTAAPAPAAAGPAGGEPPQTSVDGGNRRHAAERVEPPQKAGGLLLFRFESIFSWAEYIKLDRASEEGDAADAVRAAADMERLSVARDGERTAAALRLELDLAPGDIEAEALAGTVLLPEWHYRRRVLEPDRCRVLCLTGDALAPAPLPERLQPVARRLRRQFERLTTDTVWLRGEPEGEELDLDGYARQEAARRRGPTAARGLYRARRRRGRDLACLLLADLSLSTEAWVGEEQRAIDVIRDALFLFSEALAASGDRFALYGFSSHRREAVYVHALKTFDEAYTPAVRGRIAAVRPGYYTRMGAAVRYATQQLARVQARERLLLLLTDGKPNDVDRYEGRFGIEDTRMALRAAAADGLRPFCVTVDTEAREYLPYVFGAGHYAVIRRPAELPARLPQWYARLTRA